MSLLDSASLVMTPNAYKTSKLYSIVPTDGTGDFAVTRTGDTATRVNSSGTIEVNRTNLILQSNVFTNASWGKVNTSVTSGQTDPNGGTTAFKLLDNSTSSVHYISQSVTTVVQAYTFSVYAKAGEYSKVFLFHSALSRTFDLSNGTINNNSSASIESIGNGWYRCSITATATSGSNEFRIYLIDNSNNSNFVGTGTNGILIWRSQLQLGDITTTYIDTTTVAVTSGNVMANVPRIDYTGGGCPKLLIEPSRTNLFSFSSDINRATLENVTINQNSILSLNGVQNADLMLETTANNTHGFYKTVSCVSGTTYTYSIFVKKYATRRYIALSFININSVFTSTEVLFDLDTSSIYSNTGNVPAKIESYKDGWYRISATVTANATATGYFGTYLRNSANPPVASYTGSTSEGFYIWGGQFEAGAYPTSYIQTFFAAQTRNAETYVDSSASALIGQTEGTFFADIEIDSRVASTNIVLRNSDSSNLIGFTINNTALLGIVTSASASQASISLANTATGRFKLAIAYKSNDVVFYVNGVLVGSDTSATIPACDTIDIAQSNSNEIRFNSSGIWKTRISNSDLATLTSI